MVYVMHFQPKPKTLVEASSHLSKTIIIEVIKWLSQQSHNPKIELLINAHIKSSFLCVGGIKF